MEQHEIFNSEHVEEALKEKWEAARLEEKDLDGSSYFNILMFYICSYYTISILVYDDLT